MNLESRVETLEHELKILKNEIEETLLEIQNQVLLHYYPALRSDDSTAPADLPPRPAKLQSKSDNSSDAFAEALEQPMPRKGSRKIGEPELETFHQSDVQHRQPRGTSLLPNQHAKPPAKGLSPAALTILAKWVSDAVERVGKTGARQMVDSCSDEMDCTDAIRSSLLQLIHLSVEDSPPQELDTPALMDLLLTLNKAVHQAMRVGKQAAIEAPTA